MPKRARINSYLALHTVMRSQSMTNKKINHRQKTYIQSNFLNFQTKNQYIYIYIYIRIYSQISLTFKPKTELTFHGIK